MLKKGKNKSSNFAPELQTKLSSSSGWLKRLARKQIGSDSKQRSNVDKLSKNKLKIYE